MKKKKEATKPAHLDIDPYKNGRILECKKEFKKKKKKEQGY